MGLFGAKNDLPDESKSLPHRDDLEKDLTRQENVYSEAFEPHLAQTSSIQLDMKTIELPPSLTPVLWDTLEFAASQLERSAAAWPPDRPAPIHTRDGKWYRAKDLWTDWTPGFFAGQMWIIAKLLESAAWQSRAIAYTEKLHHRCYDRDVHDLGFVFLSSYGRWRDRLSSGDPQRRLIEEIMITAATVQSFRWNGMTERQGFIYSFNGPQSLFIDIMMNVRLLFWASRHGAPSEVLQRATEHSKTSAHYLVRRDGPRLGDEDGRTAHEAIFNTDAGRGEFRCLSTQQGYSPFTCWSRGLAWAMYGFSEAYRYTGEREFLETAQRCATFYLKHTPQHGVPYWDYGAPDIPNEPYDSSAAAVIGCALLLLADHVDGDQSRGYVEAALRVAETLTSGEFLAKEKSREEGILLQGVYHRPNDWGVNASVMWGEYFFLEFVERLLILGGEAAADLPGID